MATATDFSASIGPVGFVSQSQMVQTIAPVEADASFQQVGFSKPMDTFGAAPVLPDPYGITQHPFSLPLDAIGVTLNDQLNSNTSHEGFDPVPLVFRMRGFSTTLDQYVTWLSYGNARTPPPDEYGTVAKITSELVT